MEGGQKAKSRQKRFEAGIFIEQILEVLLEMSYWSMAGSW